MVTILFTHPWKGSFNSGILETVADKLRSIGKEYSVIDLCKDGFNPVFSEKELSVYSKGVALDPLVKRYMHIMESTDEIIFIFPIWWGTMPAILKGFFDKVLLVNSAFNYENGWTPLLSINRSYIITTSEGPTEEFRKSIEENFIPSMLKSVRINNSLWLNCEHVSLSPQHRKDFLAKIFSSIE